MLRHLGKRRYFKHNLGLATFLAFSAGFVNAAGFSAFNVLTTNVTGHAATLAIDLVNGDWHAAAMVMLWLMLFLTGSFFSGLFIGVVGPEKHAAYRGPVWGVIFCLGLVMVLAGSGQPTDSHRASAGILLFAMGMQNALVSVISGSVVRTTHLTGIFTDLGVDLARIVTQGASTILWLRTWLRLSIIGSFLLGGVSGALVFHLLGFEAFLVPMAVLLITLAYNRLWIGLKRVKRRVRKVPDIRGR